MISDSSNKKAHKIFTRALISTPLGPMIAVSDDQALFCLKFADQKNVEVDIEKFLNSVKGTISEGTTQPIKSIRTELESYFSGTLKTFKTPCVLVGSSFQKMVWEKLITIPLGQTRSYAAHAHVVGKPTAYRAVGNANGANKLAIIIPCHRIISNDGTLGGYASGLSRKQWLLDNEKKFEK